MSILIQTYHSPFGDLILGSYNNRLCICEWLSGKSNDGIHRRLARYLKTDFLNGTSDVMAECAGQLDEYFGGQRREFSIPILLAGTDFQKTVWQTLSQIPYGTTISYSELAGMIGHPASVRAVANANGANAISILLPCHRVIGADHSLTGYGGGLEKKRALLEMEAERVVHSTRSGRSALF